MAQLKGGKSEFEKVGRGQNVKGLTLLPLSKLIN